MARFELIAICLAITLAFSSVKCSEDASELESIIKAAVAENSTESTEQSSQKSFRLALTYKLGNRISGDRLLATASGNQNWSTPQDVIQTLSYPKSGTGSVVTFITVRVEQSTNLGRGYITSGGIGQRQITVVVEGKKTLYFRYTAEVYGY